MFQRLRCSEKTIKTVVDDSLEVDTLLACDTFLVRLRVSSNVVWLDLDIGIEAQEFSEHVVHEVHSLTVVCRIVPMDSNFVEAGCLRENASHEVSTLAEQCWKDGSCAVCFLRSKPGGIPDESDFYLANIL